LLILSRKKDEQIVINDDIIVTVVEVRNNVVRIGIKAPKNIPIHRSEIYQEILAEAEGVQQCKTKSFPPK